MFPRIEILKQRQNAINEVRIDRAVAAMSAVCKKIYRLLPLFFHYQHPMMPGYCDDTVVHGVCCFTPDAMQIDYLVDAGIEPRSGYLVAKQENSDAELPITGVYSMGSTSSLGQNGSSDLDIWVCHQEWLNDTQRAQLQQKCSLLEQWATFQGVEVNFFLIDKNRFRHRASGSLGCENCGSTQHILLLDEFYRTAVRLAGKRILWNIIPAEQEQHYDEYALSLYAQGILSPKKWLDLGGLSTLSAGEYFGASLWQLYKSIDSPYKAVLKTLLLEAYSWEYPDTQLLSMEIKRYQHNGEMVAFNFDAYYTMLDRVTRYLIATQDTARLDLVRRCFYLKVCEKLSYMQECPGWRCEIMRHLVREWGWDEARLAILDNRATWKIEQVRDAHNELLNAMMQSYRNLIRFARRNNLSISASPQDIGVLTRKLYAAFEVLPGKVTLVNPQISPDLSENDLTFIHIPAGSTNRTGWYLYNQIPMMGQAAVSHQPLEYNRYLNKLVAWAYFNGLLTPKTRLYIKSHTQCGQIKLQELVSDMALHFPLRPPSPTFKVLCSPCEIRHLAVIVNLEHDPTATFCHQMAHCDLHGMAHCDLHGLDVFNVGQQQQCLVGSVDLLYRNSWNELHTLHFTGEPAMLEALKAILGKMHQEAILPESVDVFCYSRYLRGVIGTHVRALISECIELRLSSTRQVHSSICQVQEKVKVVRLAGQMWGLCFDRLGVSVQKIENSIEFYEKFFDKKLFVPKTKINAEQGLLPLIVNGFASEGMVQFCFESISEEKYFILPQFYHIVCPDAPHTDRSVL